MIDQQSVLALDEIRTLCVEHASPEFRRRIKERSRRATRNLPTSRQAMRKFGISIAYSQSAQSILVGRMIESGVLDHAFSNFDHRKLSRQRPDTLCQKHWKTLSCMRIQSKVDRIISIAKILNDIDKEYGSFARYIRSFDIPRRIRKQKDMEIFWERFDVLRRDLRAREMPFFRQTTSLLQLFLDLDFDVIKPDLIIMRLARRIGLVERETGEKHLRQAVRSVQEYSIKRRVRALSMDWYMLSFGGQTEAGRTLKAHFCPPRGPCRVHYCSVGRKGLCKDFYGRKLG